MRGAAPSSTPFSHATVFRHFKKSYLLFYQNNLCVSLPVFKKLDTIQTLAYGMKGRGRGQPRSSGANAIIYGFTSTEKSPPPQIYPLYNWILVKIYTGQITLISILPANIINKYFASICRSNPPISNLLPLPVSSEMLVIFSH